MLYEIILILRHFSNGNPWFNILFIFFSYRFLYIYIYRYGWWKMQIKQINNFGIIIRNQNWNPIQNKKYNLILHSCKQSFKVINLFSNLFLFTSSSISFRYLRMLFLRFISFSSLVVFHSIFITVLFYVWHQPFSLCTFLFYFDLSILIENSWYG